MGRRIREKDRQLSEEEGKMEVWHSISYHNFFDGYEEKYASDGSDKIVRTYVAEHYRQDLPHTDSIVLRILYAVGLISAAVMFVCGAGIRSVSNQTWYVNIFQVLTLPCMAYMIYTLFYYVTMPEKMERRQYKTGVRGLRTGTLLAGIFAGITAISTLACIIFNGAGWSEGEGLCVILSFAASLIILTVHLCETRVPYEIIENLDESEKQNEKA